MPRSLGFVLCGALICSMVACDGASSTQSDGGADAVIVNDMNGHDAAPEDSGNDMLAGDGPVVDSSQDGSVTTYNVQAARDAKGIIYIKATTDEGAFYGLGYYHAFDRLWQLELYRRLNEGRLSEIMGSDHLAKDKAARIYNLKQRAIDVFGQMTTAEQAILTAYAAGVNQGAQDLIARLGGNLPEPFDDFGITSWATWEPADAIMVWTGITFGFQSVSGELSQLQKWITIEQSSGAAAANAALTSFSVDDSGAVLKGPPATAFKVDPLPARLTPPNHLIRPRMHASQGWAVRNTTTGKPALFGHPQLNPGPRRFYEANIEGATIKAHMLGFAGTIGALIGYNEHSAWTATAMGGDINDLFRLTLVDADNYQLDGNTTPFVKRTEVIKRNDGPDVILTCRDSYFGPVIDELVPANKKNDAALYPPNTAYANRSLFTTDYPGVHPIRATLGMLRATNWAEFKTAAEGYAFPKIHLIYADSNDIGYKPGTLVITRHANAPLYGVLPQDGTQTQNDWAGFVQPPTMSNPPEGFIAVANNSPVGTWYSEYGLEGSGATNRSWFLERHISQRLASGPMTPQEVSDVHLTCIDPLPVAIVDIAKTLESMQPNPNISFSPNAQQVLDLLKTQWDGTQTVTQAMFALANNVKPFGEFTQHQAFTDAYGSRGGSMILFYKDYYANPTGHLTNYLTDVVAWVNDTFENAWTDTTVTDGYGTDPAQWASQVDTSGSIKFRTAFFLSDSLNPAYDIPVTYTCPKAATIWSQSGNIYSQFIDFDQADSGATLFAPGTSMLPNTPHFADQLNNWNTGTLQPSPTTFSAANLGPVEGHNYP